MPPSPYHDPSTQTAGKKNGSAADAYFGLGQRLFATDAGETPMLEVRSITLRHNGPTAEVAADADHA